MKKFIDIFKPIKATKIGASYVTLPAAASYNKDHESIENAEIQSSHTSEEPRSGSGAHSNGRSCPAEQKSADNDSEEGEQDEEEKYKFYGKSQNRKTVTNIYH